MRREDITGLANNWTSVLLGFIAQTQSVKVISDRVPKLNCGDEFWKVAFFLPGGQQQTYAPLLRFTSTYNAHPVTLSFYPADRNHRAA
jgi:hypothetical protein